MNDDNKNIVYRVHYILLVIIFISLDSIYTIPYAHILRWIYPIMMILFLFEENRE